MNKSYGIHDKWTDLDKENNVLINSVDGVIENITVNGEPAGGGDKWHIVFNVGDFDNNGTRITFDTLEGNPPGYLNYIVYNNNIAYAYDEDDIIDFNDNTTHEYDIMPMNGENAASIYWGEDSSWITISGAATYDGTYIVVTGDCTINLAAV